MKIASSILLIDALELVLTSKSTTTLHSRLGPVLRFLKWCKDSNLPAFPPDKIVIFKFLDLIKLICAPTFPRSFMGLVVFVVFVLGLENGRVVSFSSMIIGLTTSVYMTKRKILQRPTLKIWHEKRLEAIASGQEQSNIIDQVAAGYFCCLIFARARFLDGQNSGDFVLDLVCGTIPLKSYIEASVQGSKTSFTIEREIQYLPTVAQVIDITDYSWALGWIKAMKKFGLKYGKELPLLPIPLIAGNWDILPISAETTTKWIRKFLLDTPDLDPEEIEYIKILDTRSCKTTILSWVAKTYR